MNILKTCPFLFFSLLILCKPDVRAQEDDCALNLREAQDMFNTGRIEKVYDLLKNCISSGLTREERLQAYKLMINACIFDDNIALAENYMNEFLRRYPDYIPTSADPVEFTSLLEQYDNLPRFSFGIYGGVNFSDIGVIEYYGVHDLNNIKGTYSPAGFGFQAGVVIIKHFGKNMELGLEPRFREVKYEYAVNPFPFAFVQFNETQDRLDIPLTFSYTVMKSKINPYIKAGIIPGILLSSKSELIRNYDNTGSLFYNDIQGPSTNITEKRTRVNFTVAGGGGVKYRISKGYFFIDAAYNYTLFNEVDENSRNPGNDDQGFLYYYEDNNFRINYISVSAGFAYSLYKPKKF